MEILLVAALVVAAFNMIYLSLDQSSRITGWAVFENKKLIGHGQFSVKSNKLIQERLDIFVSELEILITTFKPDKIFYEGIQYQSNVETYKKLAYIQAMIIFCTNVLDIEIKELSPSHWRSILKDEFNWKFGRARAEQKEKSQSFVKKYFNTIASEDTCDAICLGYAGIIEENKNKSAF